MALKSWHTLKNVTSQLSNVTTELARAEISRESQSRQTEIVKPKARPSSCLLSSTFRCSKTNMIQLSS